MTNECPGRDSNSQGAHAPGDFEPPSWALYSNDLPLFSFGGQSAEGPDSPSKSQNTAAPTCYTTEKEKRWCTRCERDLNLSAFGLRTKRGKRVPQPYCRECMVSYHAEWRASDVGREKFRVGDLQSKERHPERKRARDIARRALVAGRIVRGPCERAGNDCRGLIEAHHDDYSKPLEVRWACKRHHAQLDRERSLSAPAGRTR